LASLLEGFRAFGLRHLERLCLTGPIGDEGAIRLAQALKASPRPCPSLHTLSLSQTGMADAGCMAVAELTKDRCLWRVRDTALAEKLIRVKGTKALVNAFEAGGGADLMRLDLTSNSPDNGANEPAVPCPPAGVGAVLGRNLVLQKKMLLAPFLSTCELHRLSQSATWLLPYRYQLGHIRVKASDKESVLAKLPQQRRLNDIEMYGVGSSTLEMLVALRRFNGSWSLSLNVQMPKDEGRDQFCRSLRAWMEEGKGPALKHFCLYGRGLTSRGEEHLAEGLLACPELKSLTLAGLEPWGGASFTKVLKPGCVPGLESLSMQWAYGVGKEPSAIEAVATHLQAYPRPALRTLELLDVTNTSGVAALGKALASGACLGLTKLRFMINGIVFDEGVTILAAGVAGGGCPRLRHLELCATGGVLAPLLEGFLTRGLCDLEHLCLTGPIGDEGVIWLAQALKTAVPGPCHCLQTLSLSQTGMADAGCKAIAELVKEGWLGRLRELAMAENHIRIGGVKAVIDARRRGRLQPEAGRPQLQRR
jgi:hypothetical protein